jgi:phage baseplate assembly protein W
VAGLDKRTGKVLSGWSHCQQSLRTLIRTQFGERQMRYRLGAEDSPLLDRPGNPLEIMSFFTAIYSAVEPRLVNGFQYGEPRFDLARIVPRGNESGLFTFSLIGLYYPRGHLGDFSAFEEVTFDFLEHTDVTEASVTTAG